LGSRFFRRIDSSCRLRITLRICIGYFLLLAFSFSLFSCFMFASRPTFTRIGDHTVGADSVELRVELPLQLDEIKDIFSSPLPIYSILPFEVEVINNGNRSIQLYPSGMNMIGLSHGSFSITVNGDTCLLVHPAEVFMRIKGLEEPVEYRDFNFLGSMFKSFVAPMLIGYYAYKEFSEERYYRPLMEKSFYPALPCGLFGPVGIDPGEKRAGFLYVSIPSPVDEFLINRIYTDSQEGDRSTANSSVKGVVSPPPRSSKGVWPKEDLEVDSYPDFVLNLMGCYKEDSYSRLHWLDVELVSQQPDERGVAKETLSPGDHHPLTEENYFGFGVFLLKEREAGERDWDLYYGDRVDSAIMGEDRLQRIVRVGSGGAFIAGAELRDDMAVCALNFRSGSHLWMLKLREGKIELKQKHKLRRRVKNLFVIEDCVLAVTENNFCHVVPKGEWDKISKFKLGYRIDDVAMVNGSLFVFRKDGGERIKYPLSERERTEFDLARGSRTVAGNWCGYVALLMESPGGFSDTLSVFDPDSLREVSHFPIPGKVVFSGCGGSSLYLQLADRSLIRLAVNKNGLISLVDSCILPFGVSDLGIIRGSSFIAFGSEGELARGNFADFQTCLADREDIYLRAVVSFK
jgi:hypothetical protein